MHFLYMTIALIIFYVVKAYRDDGILRNIFLGNIADMKAFSKYAGQWHNADVVEKGIVHLFIVLFYFQALDVESIIYIYLYSAGVRWIFADLFLNLFRGLGIDYIPSVDGNWDVMDWLIVTAKNHKISQYVMKTALTIIPIIILIFRKGFDFLCV